MTRNWRSKVTAVATAVLVAIGTGGFVVKSHLSEDRDREPAAEVLASVMDQRVSDDRYEDLLSELETALDLKGADTVQIRAMVLAQLGHESGGLRWQRELADGSAYEGRAWDLGNYFPGDGQRFVGRDFIQVTGRANYARLSAWAYARGLVPTATFFVDNPAALATDRYAFLGVVWYWTTKRFGGKTLNELAQAGDIERVSRAINGTNERTGRANGIEDRIEFYRRALAAGEALLDLAPEPGSVTAPLQADSPSRAGW
ncbi:MAG: glycoside hydrolase family 19 protein [Mycolicibacterium sp.]|uniref:glycoside hydrolase family 19 protein n=1 Tax=Mycolicibacterium sp. TaxID=2320850 RepID=UPI003D0E39AE